VAKGKDFRALAAKATSSLLDRSAANVAKAGGVAPSGAAPAVRETATTAGGTAAPRHAFAPSHATDRKARHDIYDVDPRKIIERGPYIREWDEDGPEFQRLKASVRARKQIDTPLWVRSSGGAGNRQLVLVAGKGRLRAALQNRLPLVPVRDHGPIDDREALLLQAQENFDRSEMTPAQTAHTFHLMTEHGLSQKEIAAVRRKNPGYVSVMVRIGEALQELSPLERLALGRPGALQVRQCQVLAAAGGRGEIVAGLRELAARAATTVSSPDDLEDAPDRQPPTMPTPRPATGARPATPAQPFVGRPIRGGRTFRMRWELSDVRREPTSLATGFLSAFHAEGEQLLQAIRQAEADRDLDATARAAIHQAREVLEAALQGLRPERR
jgi:hypothetical protein